MIGIIVYSKSGNTLSVAKRLADKLIADNNVCIEQIEIKEVLDNSKTNIELISIPELDNYEKVVLCAPINGFSLCKPMQMYLDNQVDLEGKEIALLVTQHFKRSWLGGSRGLKQMEVACKKAGGRVELSSIVHWSSENRENEIEAAVNNLGKV